MSYAARIIFTTAAVNYFRVRTDAYNILYEEAQRVPYLLSVLHGKGYNGMSHPFENVTPFENAMPFGF